MTIYWFVHCAIRLASVVCYQEQLSIVTAKALKAVAAPALVDVGIQSLSTCRRVLCTSRRLIALI